jgi:hypothetical protein
MIKVPKFETVQQFADWYVANNMPYQPSEHALTVESDDAVSTEMFRSGRFQVEAYLMLEGKFSPAHAHPNVDVIIYVNGEQTGRSYDMEMHGGNSFGTRDYAYTMISIQRWDEGVPITSAAIHWAGYTAGPKHDKLISKYYPDALVKEGYADVRRDKLSGASYNGE